MRLTSTAESAEKSEVSFLAVVETILAAGASLYAAAFLKSQLWLAIGAAIAPLLLLRTDESNARCLHLFNRYLYWSLSKVPIMFAFPAAAIAALGLRIYSLAVEVIRNPFNSLAALPRNWARVALSADVCTPPDIVPGYDQHGSLEELKASGFIRAVKSNFGGASIPVEVLFGVAMTTFFIVTFIPPVLYRWSLKAASIVYSPMLWIALATSRALRDVGSALVKIRRGDLSRAALVYSAFVIVFFLGKIWLFVRVGAAMEWWNASPMRRVLSIYVAPAEVPIWQVAALVNALISIGVFIFAGEKLLAREVGESWSDASIATVLRVSFFTRSFLSCYTIACTAYLTFHAAQLWTLPRLGTKLFPWQ